MPPHKGCSRMRFVIQHHETEGRRRPHHPPMEIEMPNLPPPKLPRSIASRRSGKTRVSLLALLGGVFCVAAALGLVVCLVIILIDGPGPDPGPDRGVGIFVVFEVNWTDTKYLNQTKKANSRGRVTYQDSGYAYVAASTADLDLGRIEEEIGDPATLPGSLVGGLASYKISFVSSTCGGSSDPCQKIIDVGDGTLLLRFPRGSLKLDGVKGYSPGAGSRMEDADPAGIVELSKRY